jgi:SpoIIAA-like
MLELLPDFPAHVIAVRASGKVAGEEYRKILLPVDQEKRSTRASLNLFYQFTPAFTGMDARGMWEDAKLDLRHWRGWGRIAIIADNPMIRFGARLAALVLRRPVRVFTNTEAAAARAWVCEAARR